MSERQPLAMLLALGLAAGLGCSKTQDTAPETRIFGSPPIIQNVDVTTGLGNADCDFTQAVQGFLCNIGLFPGQYSFAATPGVEVIATYSETTVKATIVDPDDTPTQSDILIATTSYQTKVSGQTPEEFSLLMFDDAGANSFQYNQKFPANCTIGTTPTDTCSCIGGTYVLNDNDKVKGDHIFTRGFGFILPGAGVPTGNGLELLSDCIAKGNAQYPSPATNFVSGQNNPLPLKIEAVDHEGNLTTWPQNPVVNILPSSLACTPTSDQCACCILFSSDPISECKGKPGLIVNNDPSNSFPPGGLCQDFP